MTATVMPVGEEAAGWVRALYAFLAEKEKKSGSRRTVDGYSRMLRHFFGSVGKPPDRVTSQEVFTWAYGQRALGQGAVGSHNRVKARLPEFLLPLPDQDGHRRLQPV